MNTITQLPARSNVQATTNVSTLDSQATAQSDSSIQYRPCDTLAVVDALKASSQDHEFFPSTKAHIDQVTADIDDILKTHEFSARYRDEVKILDIGAGDGRVLQWMEEALNAQEHQRIHCSLYAVEKAPLHTSTYRSKGIALLGTEFNEVNFISKNVDVAFVNPPYSDFSHWLLTLINQLNFKLLYAIVPKRWQDDPVIQKAIERRDIKSVKVIAESDFLEAHRQARAQVQVVRFAFNDFAKDNERCMGSLRYKPTIGRDSTSSFQLFIEDELGLKQTYSSTTQKFHAHVEKERVAKAMQTEGSASFELVESRGVLAALLDNYERDIAHVLSEYKKISTLDASLLQELGVEYKAIQEGVKEKLFGFRGVYWALLFDELEMLSSRLTTKNKSTLLNTLAANALDFTHTNATYIISYAVEMANELIESSLIEVYQALTSEKAILRHYKSNEHIYEDRFRHNDESPNKHARYLLDYRFISSHWSNFSSRSYERGLATDARRFCDDLVVALKLIGYEHFTFNTHYDAIEGGDKWIVSGKDADGQSVELLHIRFFLNGNRHIQFNKEVMLRLNCTVSRLLGWVRNKGEFEQEADLKQGVSQVVWGIGDGLSVLPSQVLALTHTSTGA